MSFKTLAAALLRATHTVIVLFMILGWLSPWPLWLKIHLVIIPVIVLQWVLNEDKCVLTQWEHVIKGTSPAVGVKREEGFVESFLKLCMNETPQPQTLKLCIWTVTWSCWFLSLAHLFYLWRGSRGA